MNDKYIHIGFPKNFSTSLQRSYFSKHHQLVHLGIGLDNDNLGYIDTTIEKALEVYLKTCKDYKYQEVSTFLKNHFNNYFTEGIKSNKKVGISAEHLSFSFSYDSISSTSKAERLFNIFGRGTTIIMILRNQFDLIKSLFKESIRVGYSGNFEEYLYLFYKYQDRNYYYDIAYSNIYKTYSDLFGKENVKVLFFENYRDINRNLIVDELNNIKLINDLNSALNISERINFSHFNEALSNKVINKKRILNKKTPHDLSNHLLESAEKHRIKSYLEEDLLISETEKKMYEDVLIKRELIKISKENTLNERLSFECDLSILSKVQNFYFNDNKKFENEIKLNMPDKYFEKWY